MRKQNKKGFTIVELVIVIAVIAILVAVMVPTFVTLVRKAQISNDRQVVKNLNTALQTESQAAEAPKTMQGALDIAAEYGYDVAKINAKASENKILWDSKNNVYCYFDKDGGIEYIPEAPMVTTPADTDYWVVSETVDPKYSTYYTGPADAEIVATKGFDAGNSGVKNVTYKTGEAQTVVIRTYGSECVLTIEAPSSDVNFYGFAKEVNVTEVKASSLHIYGSTKALAVTKGHVVVEETGIVFNVTALDTVTTTAGFTPIVNKGSIMAAATDALKTKIAETKAVSTTLEIGTLAQLENFRDTVNAGNDFAGQTVTLTADIKLNDGWKPIGEGSRRVAKKDAPQEAKNTTTFFKGTFDGQNHTISNLNNKGFVPTAIRLVPDGGVQTYAYGLFALVGAGATIKDVNLTNVAIDTTTYSEAKGDSVGALIGYVLGGDAETEVTVDKITVSGSIKATDAVCGVVGRISVKSSTIKVTNCTNNANITTARVGAGIVRAYDYDKTGNYSFILDGNVNNGQVTETGAKPIIANIAVVSAGMTVKDNSEALVEAKVFPKAVDDTEKAIGPIGTW